MGLWGLGRMGYRVPAEGFGGRAGEHFEEEERGGAPERVVTAHQRFSQLGTIQSTAAAHERQRFSQPPESAPPRSHSDQSKGEEGGSERVVTAHQRKRFSQLERGSEVLCNTLLYFTPLLCERVRAGSVNRREWRLAQWRSSRFHSITTRISRFCRYQKYFILFYFIYFDRGGGGLVTCRWLSRGPFREAEPRAAKGLLRSRTAASAAARRTAPDLI